MDEPIPFIVNLADCRWTLQEISLAHIFPSTGTIMETGPIVVSRMNDGNYFVHNGRHRCIRALLSGLTTIFAVNLYH